MRLADVTVEIDVEKIFPLAGLGGPGFETGHGHAVLLQGHQQVMYRTWLVGHRYDQGRAIAA